MESGNDKSTENSFSENSESEIIEDLPMEILNKKPFFR